jgi:RNA polymerase sigma-70 factor (ECF subfamily)
MKEQTKIEFEAFRQVSEKRLLAYMRCACNRPEDAEDLVQDCYLRAFRAWGRFNGSGSRQAWLFTIARRAYIDWLRSKKRRGGTVSLDRIDHPAAPSEHASHEDAETVWQIIEGLPPEQREVIRLRFAAQLSYAEIAQTLGLPIGTVRSRLHRALKAVREKTRGREDDA